MRLICKNCKDQFSNLKSAYPYNTIFNGKKFSFLKCSLCKITSIYPNLDSFDIDKLYNTDNYQSKFYSNLNQLENKNTLNYINKYIKKNSSVLDYGCGNGSLLNEISKITKNLFGVDTYVNNKIMTNTNIKYYNYLNFFRNNNEKFDIIILRDVTEHLNEPNLLLIKLLKNLNKKGIIYIEGPAEKELSLVNIFIHIYAYFKDLKSHKNNFAPYHVNYYSLKTKKDYLKRLKNLKVVYSKTYETGWPYNNAGFIKNIISNISKTIYLIIKLNYFKIDYGNRFIIILKNVV